MEHVIEELRERAVEVPIPLELPTEDDLVDVEEQILIPIPFVMREFLMQASDVIYGSLEPVTASDPQMHTYLPEVAALAWSQGMPREYIPLCEDGGSYYCVDQQDEVFLWSEDGISEERWESAWHWVFQIWLES